MYRTQSVWDQLHDKVLKALYGDTPYGATWGELVGNVPKLSPTRVAGIERIFRPQNLVIVTMGWLDDEQIFPHLERTFGSLAKQPAVHAPQCSLPPREPFRQELLHPCMTIPFVHQVVRCGPPEPEGLARVQLLADILTRDYTSPLYWNLCEVDGDTYVPFTTVSYGRPENLLHLEYSAAEEDIDPILGKVGGELEKLAQRQIPISDFRRLQRWSVNAARDALDDPVELAEWYITNSAVRRFVRPREYLDMIRGISREELGDAVAQWREGMGTIIFKPAPGAADHEVLR
jgi:predicted Zn-dependent peptidase